MQLWKAIALLAYLLFATSLTGYAVYALWSAEPLVTADRTGEPNCSEGRGNPFLASLNPEVISTGSSASEIFLRGCSFTAETKVKFNGAERTSTFADPKHIRVPLNVADVSTVGR